MQTNEQFRERRLITPEIAAEWLKRNTDNLRPPDKGRIKYYAKLMQQGKWYLTHQGIAFYPDGVLCDGQHRLAAIVEAGIPVEIHVDWNVPYEARLAIDIGKKRTLRDICSHLNRHFVDACSFITLRLLNQRVAQPAAIETLAETPLLTAFERTMAATIKRGRSARICPSAVRAAALIHAVKHMDYIAEQWPAYVGMTFDQMTPSVQSLFRVLSSGDKIHTRDFAKLAAQAWTAFDPRSPNLSRIVVKDALAAIHEMRKEIYLILPADSWLQND